MHVTFMIFWLSLAASVYIYAAYPSLLLALSRLRPRPVKRDAIRPRVTVLIAAYNEEPVIARKIENTLALHYVEDQLEVLVVSDGSTDATDDIVHRYESERVTLLRLPRCGKGLALNEGIRHARGDILVFTDANTLLEPESLIPLVENFADPEVGGVCGNKKYVTTQHADTTGTGENLYWRFDKWQKHLESRIGSIVAADGTLYGVRRTLYVPITDPSQVDDIAVSTRVVLQGFRLVYEPRAVAFEEAPEEGREEFKRKIRVTNQSVRALLGLGRSLWTSGFYSVELLSHKLFRHLAPGVLLALFASNAMLVPAHSLFAALFLLQVLCYALGATGFALRHHPLGRLRTFTIPYYFCLVNAAALVGVLSILTGWRARAWTPRAGFQAVGSRRCGDARAL